MKTNATQKSGAFSLIEIMIVIAIIALLAAIAIPNYFRHRDIRRAPNLVSKEIADARAVVVKSINPDTITVDYNDASASPHTAKISRGTGKIIEVDGQPWPTPPAKQ